MRVLQICEPPDGGAALNATELSLGLSRRGFEIDYAGPPDARGYKDLESSGIPVHRLPLAPSFFNVGDDVAAFRGIKRLLRQGRYDLVHLHSAKAGVLGRLAASSARPRVVYSPHSFPFVGAHSRPRLAFSTWIERRLGSRADAILCVCDWERRLAIAHDIASPDRLHVIHNGCDPCDQGASPDPGVERLRRGGPVIGAIAVLREQKRLDLLIDAAPAILGKDPNVRVVIVGDGPERGQLQAQAARLGLDREERFAMLAFEGPSSRYLRGMDVFVLPSGWEAFPIGVLEALACGVPQVATDVGGTGEAVSDGVTGLLVPPLSPEALAGAVLDLLADDALRSRMSTASRARHRESFLTERMVGKTADLYESVAAGAGGD
ncbi:MAG TPA: glycosyltransferase family 4 protein [Solirubrobacterales bacterium]